jgi:hypothetical protein
MNINDRLRAAFDAYVEAPDPKPTPNFLAKKFKVTAQSLSGALSLMQLYRLTETFEGVEPDFDATPGKRGPKKDPTSAHSLKVERTRDIATQRELLTRFGSWTGKRPRGEWFTTPEGERARSTGADQRMAMEQWLNSSLSPVDLGEYLGEATILQWFYRNRMPDLVRQSIEALMASDVDPKTVDIWALPARYLYKHPEAVRIDCATSEVFRAAIKA